MSSQQSRRLSSVPDDAAQGGGLSDFDRRWMPSSLRRAASLLERHLPEKERVADWSTITRLRALADDLEAEHNHA